jgi:hypothetical protein
MTPVMERMRFRRIRHELMLLAGTLVLASCVTINIYFPAAAAEKAADRIIDEVWQLKEGGAPTTVKPLPGEAK